MTFEPEVPGGSPRVGVIGVSLECVTDGAVGPTRHIFPTVSFSGHATEIIAVDPRPLLSVEDASAREDDPTEVMRFLFKLNAPATQNVTINYYTRLHPPNPPDTAQAVVDDYTPVPSGNSQTAVIQSGELEKTAEITIIDDELYELPETFELVWEFVPSDPCAEDVPQLDPDVNRLSSNPTLYPPDHPTEPCRPVDPLYWMVASVGTILNDDMAPQLLVSSPSVAEDAGPMNPMNFTVSLGAATAVDVEFTAQTLTSTSANPATGGPSGCMPLDCDYETIDSTRYTIIADPNGAPSQTVDVTIVDDSLAEPDEDFILQITDVNEHALAPPMLDGIGTILDDDPTIRIEGNPARIVEGGALVFDVTAANVVSGEVVTVDFAVTDGPATGTEDAATFGSGLDYTVASQPSTTGTLTFSMDGPQTITVNTFDDDIDETDEETLTVTLLNWSTNARLVGDASVTGVIEDDDDIPKLETDATVTLSEGDTVNLDFNLSRQSSADVEFGFSHGPTADTTDVDAGPADYSLVTVSPLTIATGGTGPETVEIDALSDSYLEADETFELKVDYANNADRVPETVTVTITDAPPADFTVDDPEADEGKPLTFTISLNPAIPTGSDPVTVFYTVSIPNTGNPAEPEDVDVNHLGSGSVTFMPGEATKTVSVGTLFDLVYPEGTETLNLTIDTDSLPTGFASSKPTGTGMIKDVAPPVLSVGDARAEEGANLDFVITLNPAAVRPVTFDVCTYARRASAGTDYDGSIEWPLNCSSVTISPGQDTHIESVETFTDYILDDNENMEMRVQNPINANLGDGVGEGTIEEVLALTVAVADAVAVEGDKAGFLVKLNIKAPETINLHYTTRNGTASSGLDYEATSGVLEFVPGDVEKIVLVQTWTDDIDDPDENFFLDIWLDDSSQGTVTDDTGEGVIKPYQTPTFSIDNASADEGELINVNVRREGDLSQTSTVQYRTAELTTAYRPATGGYHPCTTCDYYTTDGTLTFDEGEELQSFTVQTVADSNAVGELPYEEFKAELFNPQNGTLKTATGLLTIREDCINPTDPDAVPPTITGIDSTVHEGDALIEVEFEIFPALCSLPSVWYNDETTTGSATVFEDFLGNYGGGVFHQSEIVFNTIRVLEDDIDEPDETMDVVITAWRDRHGNLAPAFINQPSPLATATVTIVDNDDPPRVSIFDTSAVEGSFARFSLRLDAPSGKHISVPYYTDDLSTGPVAEWATAGVDYRAIPETSPGLVEFLPGEIEAYAEVEIESDPDTAPLEKFRVVLGEPDSTDPTFAIGDGAAIGTIIDGTVPTLSVTPVVPWVLEDSNAQFRVTLDQASTEVITVDYATVPGSGNATEGVDYTAKSGSLTFAPGELEQLFEVKILPDNIVEDHERFLVELSDPVNAVLLDASAAVIIAGECVNPENPDHDPPTVTIQPAEVTEGAASMTFQFTVTYEPLFCSVGHRTSGHAAVMDVVLTHDSTEDADFYNPGYNLKNLKIFLFSQTTNFLFNPAAVDDSLIEGDEFFEIEAKWASYFDTTTTSYQPLPSRYTDEDAVVADGKIIDDDDLTLISVADASGREGDVLRFPVRLSGRTYADLSVDYVVGAKSTGNNLATPVVDFEPESATLTFPSGQVEGFIEVQLHPDDEPEGDEEFLVTLDTPSDGGQIAVATAVGTILDVVQPRLDVSDAEADEGQVLSFEVTLDQASIDPVQVEYATVAQTATEGIDYLRASGVVRFAPGETSQTVTVAALLDNWPLEGDETFLLQLSNPVDALMGVGIGSGTIRNLGVPEISVTDTNAVEGASVLFEVALSNRANRDVTVNYTTVPRTTSGDVAATAGDDYNPVSGAVTITAGSTAVTVAVPTSDDLLDEYREVFGLVLSTPDYGTLKDSSATGTIVDNDSVPQLLVDDVFTAEDAATMAVVVRLNAISGRSVAVDYTLTNDTATAGADYLDSSGTLTIPAGRLSTTLDVTLIDDDADEGAETFTIGLTNPLNASIGGTGTARLTIIDDEGLPTLYVESQRDGSVEGDDAQITLRLSAAASADVSVAYQTSGGDATPGVDYVAQSSNTILTAGQLEKTLSTTTVDDSDTEDTEYFDWVFSNAVNAQLASTSGSSTSGSSWILDNDGVPTLSVGDTSVNEGNPASFTVRLGSPADTDVTVSYETQRDPFAGTAAAVPVQDFAVLSDTVTILQGQRTATVEVPVPDDALNEGIETFWLRLDADSATGADVTDAVGVGSILDDDPLPNLSIHNATAIEGDPVPFALRLDNPSGRVVRAEYVATVKSTAVPENQATPVRDFDAAPKSVLIPAGVTEVTAELDTVIDSISEYEEYFLVRVFNATHAAITDSQAEGTIIDQNDLPRATIADTEAVEGAGSAEFTVTLSHPSTAPITFLYSTTDGTAKVADDYVAITDRTLTVAANTTSATFTVALVDDTISEPDETFNVSLRNPSGATLIDDESIATIIDDDGLPRFVITDSRADETDSSIGFTVTLSHQSALTTSVDYATFNRTATQPEDYAPISGTLTFDAGTTTQTLTVPINDDLLDEFDETLTMRLSNPVGAIVRPTEAVATGTIDDDDPEPTLAVLSSIADEGEQLSFTAFLDAPSGRTVSATYNTIDDTDGPYPATPADDYISSSGLLSFSPGEITKTITATTLIDALTESAETLLLALSNPRYATLISNPATATGTIRNQELPAITINDSSALEGDTMVFTLNLDRPSDTDVTITYVTRPATASVYTDYFLTLPRRVTIPVGQTQADLTVVTVADHSVETNETFLIELTGVTGNAQIRFAVGVGTILENAVAPTLTVDDVQISEGADATFAVTLTRTAQTTGTPVSVGYRTHALTADEDIDYSARTGRLDFPESTTTQQLTVTVPTTPDELPETNETFQLVLDLLQGDLTIEDSTGEATILDDDTEPTLSVNPAETDEGTPLVFTATLNSPSGRQITADYRTNSLTATDGVDYATTVGSLVFDVGTISQDITVRTLPDRLIEDDETFELALSNPVGATLGSNGTGTIIDATRPGIRVADAAVQEGGNLEFTVTLNRQSSETTTVDYATSDDTAKVADADYTAVTGTLTFQPGVTQMTVPVDTLPDDLNEPDETLTLTLSNQSADAKILDATATGTIHNATLVTITISDAAGVENLGTWITPGQMIFDVRLSRPADNTVTVDWQTLDSTAMGHATPVHLCFGCVSVWDYLLADGTVSFAPGETLQTIQVTTYRDGFDELPETFFVELDNASDAVLNPDSYRATGTIYDVDPTPFITTCGTSLPWEIDGYRQVCVRTSAYSDREISMDWSVEELSPGALRAATAGDDFEEDSDTLTFESGTSRGFIEVYFHDDNLYEGTEYYKLVLSNPVNAGLTSPIITHEQPIWDDESYIIDASNSTGVEGNNITFLIERTGYRLNAASINYQTVDGTAVGGAVGCLACDYISTSGTHQFGWGEKTFTVTVPTVNDSQAETPESFELRLTTAPNSPIGLLDDSATGTILDTTERIVSLRIRPPDGFTIARAFEEGTDLDLAVELDAPSSQVVTGSYESIPGTATSTGQHFMLENNDYRDGSGTWTIQAGSISAEFSIPLYNDGMDEPDETFQVRITNPQGAVLSPQHTVNITIEDNDDAPAFEISDSTQQEGDPIEFTVTLKPRHLGWIRFPTAFETTIDYTTVDLSAKAGVHYTATSGTLTFEPGEPAQTITVFTDNDNSISGDRVFAVNLSNPMNASITRGTGQGRITENDCVNLSDPSPPLLSMASTSADEGENLDFTVTLDKPFCDDVAQAVTFSTSLGTASSADVTTPSAVLGFKAGQTQVTYSGVLAIEDNLDEPDETITATAAWHSSMPTNYQASVSATGTIIDDDDEPNVRIIDATSSYEGGPLTFIVTLDSPSGKQISVDYATNTAGTATTGDDYTAVSGTLTFALGETTKQIVVQSAGDTLNETDETFQVVLSNPTNVMIGDTIGIGTIENDDPLPVLSISDAGAAEDDLDGVRFTITLSTASGRDVTVVYSTTDGTATVADNDYTAITGTAMIIAGQTTTTIEIQTTADAAVEGDETFTVQILAQHLDDANGDLYTLNATISPTNHTATGTITNDDT